MWLLTTCGQKSHIICPIFLKIAMAMIRWSKDAWKCYNCQYCRWHSFGTCFLCEPNRFSVPVCLTFFASLYTNRVLLDNQRVFRRIDENVSTIRVIGWFLGWATPTTERHSVMYLPTKIAISMHTLRIRYKGVQNKVTAYKFFKIAFSPNWT